MNYLDDNLEQTVARSTSNEASPQRSLSFSYKIKASMVGPSPHIDQMMSVATLSGVALNNIRQ